MRGKRLRGNFYPSTPRIIPAHAGQTVCGSLRAVECTDHPRACGANPLLIIIVTFVRWTTARIIPAHAGQTESLQPKNTVHPDHPRACGANFGVKYRRNSVFGSSPRMRGKPCLAQRIGLIVRIIPAHAGQTVRFYAKTLERWTLNNWIRTVAPIFVLLFLPPVIGQNAYIERHYSNQSFSWFSKLHYASAFDLSLVA